MRVTCSQDLKTGFLIGSTPVRQQGALLIGVLTSVLAVGWTAYGLNIADATERSLGQPFPVKQELIDHADTITSRTDGRTYRYVRLAQNEVPAGMKPGVYLVNESSGKAEYSWQDGVGSTRFPAPQARLMLVVIDGLLTHRLPWNLILIGVAIALFMELLGFGSLTFAVGVYLPLSSTMPVFLGGVVRKLCDKIYRRPPDDEAEKEGTCRRWSAPPKQVLLSLSVFMTASTSSPNTSPRSEAEKPDAPNPRRVITLSNLRPVAGVRLRGLGDGIAREQRRPRVEQAGTA